MTKVKEGFTKIVSGAKEGALDASSDIEAVKKGEYTIFSKDYWKSDNEDDSNPLSKIGSIAGFITRLSNAPGAMIGYVMTKVKAVFTKIIDGARDIDEDNQKIIQKAENGDISVFSKDYWKMPDKEDNPLGMIGTIGAFIQRLVNAPIVLLKSVFKKIQDKFGAITGWFKKLFGEENTEGGGSGKGGYGRKRYGFSRYSQLDPSISGMQYNGHTIGEAGCGPVAAANLINNIKGGNVSVQDTAKYATSLGYKPKDDGTDPRYMSSILTASGIRNENVNRSGIDRSLKEGNPVVIMGRGNSPSSPYGNKNLHYITAMGYDRNGNIIVDDPYESGYKTYKKSEVVNGAMKSVSAKRNGFGIGTRRITPRRSYFGFGRFGFGKFGSDTPVGSYVEIPSNLGKYETYMGYHMVTNKAALAGQLKTEANNAGRYKAQPLYDMENCATVDGRLGIATVPNIGGKLKTEIGDYLDVYFDDGDVWKCIRLDAKCQTVTSYDPNPANEWGHQNGKVVVEVIYHDYSGKCINHSKKVTKIVKVGDYDSGKAVDSNGTTTTSSSTASNGSSGLMSQFTNLGNSMVKALFGEEAYNAFYGSNNSGNGANTGTGTNVTPNGTVESFVQAALNEEGYLEKASNSNLDDKTANPGSSNYTKYGKHFGNTGPGWPWCAQFVSWSADQAGIPEDAMKRSASVATIQSHFKSKDRFHTRSSGYTPKRGDVITFGNGDHVGIVTGIKDGQVKTIEGNTSDKVAQRSYAINSSKIAGYGDLGLGAGTGTTGLDGTGASTKVYGKGGFGKGYTPEWGHQRGNLGVAKSALMENTAYRSGTISIPARTSAPVTAGGGAVDYATFLQTIVTVLMNIADNTALLGKVLEILSNNFGIDIDKTDIDKAKSKTKAQTEKALTDLVNKTNGNTVGVSKLLNNKDTEYIVAAMRAIATE